MQCYFPAGAGRTHTAFGKTLSFSFPQKSQQPHPEAGKNKFSKKTKSERNQCKALVCTYSWKQAWWLQKSEGSCTFRHYELRAVEQKSFHKVEEQWGLWKNICFKSVSSAFCMVLRRNFTTERNVYWNISLEKKSSVFLLQSIGSISLKN